MAITADHIRAAFVYVRQNGFDPARESTKFDVVDPLTGERFPPKVIRERAEIEARIPHQPTSGGEATNRILNDLGFKTEPKEAGADRSLSRPLSNHDEASLHRTSGIFEVGRVYPREELIEMFSITDATVNTGVFRPAGTKSIWLFVTRHKTSDRTQYQDQLDGDVLQWEGQTSGRTDRQIVEHGANGDELLLFYRDSKRQHSKAGFRYEGEFHYLSHEAGAPSRFLLQRTFSSEELATSEGFDPTDVEDSRQRTLASIARRQGQTKFRRTLMKAYGGRCAITGCPIEPLLEAAHIRGYLGPATNHVTNGIMMRADIHTLFDLGLLTIGGDLRVTLSPRLMGTEYASLAGTHIRLPEHIDARPSLKSLEWHREYHAVELERVDQLLPQRGAC